MKFSLHLDGMASYLNALVANYFPVSEPVRGVSREALDISFQRIEHCFSRIQRKYYTQEGEATFDHVNGDHMAAFLWFLSNTIWTSESDTELPTQLSYLNRIMHGVDLFYWVPMPEIFILVHPLGTVIGRGQYEDYLVVYQQCTIGATESGYPTFAEGAILYSGSSVLGRSSIGENVVFAARSYVVDCAVPSNTLVTGQYPNHRLLPNKRSVRARCFDPPS